MMYSIGSKEIDNICNTLSCKADEIYGIEQIKKGLTNLSFSFYCRNKRYVYRNPGEGTGEFINRHSEAFSENVAHRLGIDSSVVKIDSVEGWKISRYIDDYCYIDPENEEDCRLAITVLKKLHDSKTISPWNFDYSEQTELIEAIKQFKTQVDFEQYVDINEKMLRLGKKLAEEGHPMVLCHNDAWHWNMLKDKSGKVTLIDWEYSGNSYPPADIAYFTASLNCSDDYYMHLAEIYEGRELNADEVRFYYSVMAIVLWYWFVWALYEESIGTEVPDKEMWKTKAINALNIVEEMYEGI